MIDKGSRLADRGTLAAVPAVAGFCHALGRGESQGTDLITEGAGGTGCDILDYLQPALASNDIQRRPQGAEVTAVKAFGYQVHDQNEEDNTPFNCQGVKEDCGHDLAPDKTWR